MYPLSPLFQSPCADLEKRKKLGDTFLPQILEEDPDEEKMRQLEHQMVVQVCAVVHVFRGDNGRKFVDIVSYSKWTCR